MGLTQASEDGLKISNTGTNGQFLQKQSGNTGGLTWADATSVGGATGVDFNDDVKARFGTGNDLELYHNGTNSYINNGEGDLWIKSNGDDLVLQAVDDVLIRPQDGENGIKVLGDGAVELYHDNDKKFNTWSNGCTVTGNLNINGHADFGDDERARFGASDDLQIYHDGTYNYLLSTGDHPLIVEGDEIQLRAVNNEKYLKGVKDGSVELYYDDAKKFETVTGGVTVTGTCTATSFAGDGSSLTGLQAGATGGNSGANAIFWENEQTVTHDYTISNNKNAGTWGPVTINSGVTVTVGDGEYWTIM